MSDGITMDDMEDQTTISSSGTNHQVNGNSRLHPPADKHAQDDTEDLEDLEQSLQALDENLDRSSPDLWPDHIPGVGQYLPATPYLDSDTPRGAEGGPGCGGYLHNMTRDEMETLMQLGNLNVQELMSEVKRLQNIAYQLGQEESKEMTRGKYLNILKRKHNH